VVLDQIRYLYRIGDFEGSLRLSEDARAAWAGPDDNWDDEPTFACIDRVVNALLALGRYHEADDLSLRLWDRIQEHPRFGRNHPRTHRIASVVSLTNRIVGRYGEALALDRARSAYYRTSFGPEHQEVDLARSNEAVSLRLIGKFAAALEIDEALVAARRAKFGATNYWTLFSVSNLARDLYGLGRYAEALELQQSTLDDLKSRLNARHEYVILADRTIALCLRKTGQLDAGLEHSQKHFLMCRGLFGSDHGHTLAAQTTYANAIRAIAAAHNTSVTLAWNRNVDAVNRYRRGFGDRNPLTLAAAVNQAVILRTMGERRKARQTGEPAYHALYQQLGADHPYTQAAAVGLANDLIAAHEEPEAMRLLTNTLDDARRQGRHGHPDMLIAAVNLGLIVRVAEPASGETMMQRGLDALRSAIGPSHPQVLAAERGERGECDVEPPPF
jgi:tetratricopeptide (TPR) repeat protein